MNCSSQSVASIFRSPLCTVLTLACLTMMGCAGAEDYQTVTTADAERAEAHADHDHGHHHTAPHGGHLIELGSHQYNAEVVLEGDPKQLVVYLLDAHAENPVAIESTSITFTPEEGEALSLEAQPQEGDADGKASRFVATGDAVAAIADIEDVHGSVKVSIDGTDYEAALAHDHDEHGHDDHDGHGHDDDEGEHKDEAATK